MKQYIRIFAFFMFLLVAGSAINQAWAYKVTYHILTKGIDNTIYHMSSALNGKRLEAVRVVDNNATTVDLPAAYKSPLAHNFKYYESSNVTKVGPVRMYDWGDKDMTYHYTINDESDGKNKGGSSVTGDMEVYVTYEYNAANGIADLSGTKEYNLTMSDGFWGLNRGRNNRIAIFQKTLGLIQNKDLVSEDFVQFDYTKDNKIPGTNISAYWQSGDNKNTKSAVAGQFHFIFKFEGSDPYNIIIGTAYNRDYAYLEKHGTENSFRYKWYKGSHLFRPSSDGTGFFMSSDDYKEYTLSGNTYNPDPVTDLPYTERSGYFKSKGIAKDNLNYSTFALLNSTSTSGGYVFMVSRFVDASGDLSTPGDYNSASYNYLSRDNNYNNLKYENKKLSAASASYSTDPKIYLVKEYVFRVRKHITGEVLSSEVARVSEYFVNGDPKDFVPDELKRKYVTFTGAYKDAACTPANKYATFKAVDDDSGAETDGSGRKVIYLDYETNMPFETSATSATYDDLKWYNLQADKNSRYVTFLDGINFNTYQNHSRNGYDSHFAFIGDPYDLKIVSRKATEDASTPSSSRPLRYLAFASGEGDEWKGNITYSATATVWEMKYDDNTGDYAGCFRLNESGNTDKNLHWNFGTGSYPLIGSATTAVRLTVIDLPTINYNYYIMRSDESIAVMTQAFQEPGVKLDYDHIPEVIRSPFLEDVKATIKFYGGFTGDDAEKNAIDAAKAGTKIIDYAPDFSDGSGNLQHIVVRYDFSESSNLSKINGVESTAKFNVRLNGQYIYYDSSDGGTIKSSATIEDKDGDGNLTEFDWILGGSDPYTLNIKSVKANKYITINENDLPSGDEAGDGTPVTWSDAAPSLKYIVKLSSKDEGQTYYEVMAATGQNRNALDETFNFGRPADNTVKMYSDWSYVRGGNVLRFQLTKNSAVNVTYHLVDIKNNTELLSVQTRQESGSAPSFPPDYRSPLVATYTYWSTLDEAKKKTGVNPTAVAANDDIYVTYTANNLVDMSGRTMYLMKYAMGDTFKQEDGSDGISETAQKAVYPYCNGDGNFFVYGEEQYDIQQQGAASTRTRWAWYVESVNTDPYHVKIRSRQQETYPAGSGNDYNAYFRTYKPNGYSEVVTTLAWPGISGEQGTEYMVLGSAGQFRLVTTYGIDLNNDGDRSDPGEDELRAVNSFEQYWKTWNTIRLKVLGDNNAEAKQSDPNTVPATPAAPTAAAAGMDNRTYLSDPNKMGWHSYEQWAYAIRWNDYNVAGEKNKKGWEPIEHWYQTVKMGEGYFDFVPTTIDPVLILLDQHGWEVMRKPLPSSPDDLDKYKKYDAIRPYDSPMVKEYHFWTKTSKRTGFHQYFNLGQRVTVDGEPFVSTSLTNLPPYEATNVHDAKGNLLDQYVTYVVKDEYVKACNVALSYTDDTVDPADSKKKYSKVTATVTGVPFLIQQGSHFVSATNATTLKNDNEVPATNEGGMSQYIITNADKLTTTGDKKNELWYLMPNIGIDSEMGYANYAHAWASDYDRKDKVQVSGFNSWAFDPYNIQISSVAHTSSYFVTNATKAEIDNGSIVGDGTTNTLDGKKSVPATLEGGMDNRTLQMTNATFMAVQDKNGNMQLMPRFDQEKRLKNFSELVYTDDAEAAKTYTKLYRPLVYNYHIIDNSGNESLRYQGGGDLLPQTPEWFQSQLATDYKYYANNHKNAAVASSEEEWNNAETMKKKTATNDADLNTQIESLSTQGDYFFKIGSTSPYTYKKVTIGDEITESLAGATLTDNNVYVRYSYDETADFYKILQGKWLTMTLNTKDAVYSSGVKQASGEKPNPVNADHKDWQWKFIATSQTDPDPYAVSLYNRSQSGATSVNGKNKFALLNWYDGEGVDPSAYTLAVAGTNLYSYDFVNGASMNTSTAATTALEGDVKSTSCAYTAGTKIKLNDDVQHTYTYKVYTNDDPDNPVNGGKYGVFAVSADQDYSTAEGNDYVPTLPEEIKSPLLNMDQFKYYGAEADMGVETKELKNIFGLYDDIVYVRYADYDLKATEYKVPNVKGTEGGHVAKGDDSNDAALDINGELIYNIIWYDDNMMSSDGTSISGGGVKGLDGADAYVWQFEGKDPYAIKIKHKKSGKYAVGTDALAASATSTFMLLPSTDSSWEYGMLQVTGDSNSKKLTGAGNSLTTDASTEPKKFIIFGLSTHKVIYHLVIANIGNTINIPYREAKGGSETTKPINGSTQRDLTTGGGATYQLGTTIHGVNYCVDDGHITLGDPLKVPEQLKRPNCKYFFYVDNIKTDGNSSFRKTAADETAMESDARDIASVGYYYYKIGTSTFAYKRVHVTTAKDGETPAAYTVDDCTEDDYNNAWQYDDTLNNLYKGLLITKMGTEPELLGKTVVINVVYAFDDGLTTNNGSNFVTAPSQKKWYTWETSDDKLAQYTGAAGFKMLEGHESHYTNDFLWSPVGDPYGFKMYNRYEYKTNGQTTHVMTTEAAPADGGIPKLLENTGVNASRAIYELFAGDTDGYFFVRPMLNNDVAIYNDNGTMKLSLGNATEYTFGLSLEQLKPYYDRAGYVGGLTPGGKTAYENANGDLQAIQDVVYDDAYIVKFATGYYRLHSQPDIKDLSQRYLSGYTHKTELDGSIPMHFYERKGVSTTFEALGATGYTKTAATQGQLPISAPEYDPASIFRITGTLNGSNNSLSTINMSTQGLNVIENKMGEGTATSFTLMDIGGAVLLIHDNATPAVRKYLCFDQSDAAKIYDIQYKYGTPTDYAKWCLEPANNMGLYIETHSGGEEETLTELWYYSSYCVPFDLLIADKDGADKDHSSNAYTCIESESPWNENMLHPKPIGKYNTGTYLNNDYFVPAGTPVLFSTKRATSYIKATIPTTSPSTPISTIFSAKYLEQLLTPWDNNQRVYVFGPKMEGTLDINTTNGTVNAVLPSLGNTNVGFHLNANQNKESGLTKASWTRNNYYVLHNKIYYRAGSSGAGTRGVQFVPVVFEAGAAATDVQGVKDYSEGMLRPGNVYNLQGRCVATEEMVKDGTWKNNLTPGVYIMNGKKIIVR